MMQVFSDFEKKVLRGLEKCNVNFSELQKSGKSLGIAVSGGADSVSLLISISEIFKNQNIPLKIISVNHNIRPENETSGDAEFVVNLCNILKSENKNITCTVCEILRGSILDYAQKNGTGIEDAARTFRYSAFKDFIEKENVAFLCLAHNKNDQVETGLMRFLQGNDLETLSVIPLSRNQYIRPLLDVSRNEIEEYLKSKKIGWRTDKTNFDTNYLRNKIRQKLIPFLDENFNGWQNSVADGIEKSEMNKAFIASEVEKNHFECRNDMVILQKENYEAAPRTIKYQLLLKGINLAGCSQRVPFAFLNDVVLSFDKKISQQNENYSQIVKNIANIEIILKKTVLLFKKCEKINTDLVFFDIIKEEGEYNFPFGTISVNLKNNDEYEIKINSEAVEHNLKLPFCIKNAQLDDDIKTASGELKKIADIYSDWHVSAECKKIIPVIQEIKNNQFQNTCILGKIFGYKDWIVK